MPEAALRPVTHADRPLLRDWLSEPHVRAWWGPPEQEIAALRADLDGSTGASGFDMRIAEVGGDPVGCVQDGPLHATGEPYLQGLEAGARAMDDLIGPPERPRRGLASAMIRRRAHALLALGVPCVHVDPDAANAGSAGAARWAGLAHVATHPGTDATTLVVRLPRPD